MIDVDCILQQSVFLERIDILVEAIVPDINDTKRLISHEKIVVSSSTVVEVLLKLREEVKRRREVIKLLVGNLREPVVVYSRKIIDHVN